MTPIEQRLQQRLGPESRAALDELCVRVQREPAALALVLPSLARRFGRERLGGGVVQVAAPDPEPGAAAEPPRVDLDAWRACDAAGLALLRAARPDAATLYDLWQRGDLEERAIVLRALACLPLGDATVRLLGEVQRTNTLPHFEAGCCDSNVAVRARAHPQFPAADLDRLVLKLAFLGLRLRRMLGVEAHANPDLSRMLQDLATEREAAGRAIWPDTDRLCARAPVAGTVARVIGGLEHGDDQRRLAAAEALLLLNRGELRAFAKERLGREPRPEIRALLQQAAAEE